MEGKREQALVGLFVVVATGVLVSTLFAIGGGSRHATTTYRTYFKNAGGLEPGSIVRYGGIKVGRIDDLRIDKTDPRRIEVRLRVESDTPVKTDSTAKIASLSALGENYLEILAGSQDKPALAANGVMPSKEFFGITDLADVLNDLGPSAQDLVDNLNDRATDLKTTFDRVNDLLNDKNRQNLSSALGNVNGMLEEDRPRIHSALGHVDATTAKLPDLVDQFKKTVNKADDALAKLDAVLGDNRADLHASIAQLRKTLADASTLVNQLDRTTSSNADNFDETLENIRITTENLKEFTDTIKTRPSSLIRSSSPPEHKPGKPDKP